MPGNIKGITIEFAGDTTKLDKSLREINRSSSKLDKELKQVNRALKFNPTSVDLWRQKQTLLNQKVDETRRKVDLLKQKQKQMDAKGVDKTSKEYRELQREIITAESKLKHFKGELRRIGNVKLKAIGEQFKQVGQKMTDAGRTMSMYVTAPLVAGGAVAVKKFAEVDKVMTLTNSTMKNSEEEAQLLNQAMKDAAASSTFGMNDAAQATLNFARSGLDAEQAANALAPAMALAAGEGGNLDTVSGGLVATINGFHDGFEQAGHYADVFANACNNSALDVNSLSQAMSVAAPIFSSAGYSVNDAALYMGVMANNGIEANVAANSLKTGLARLVSPAADGAKMMEKLGISVTNSDGTMKDSVTVQKELHDAFSQLSESEQLAAASAIFGKNQMAPWLALINTAPGDVDSLNQAIGTSGTAMKMQADMMKGFAGSIEQLKSGLDVLATSFGEALAPMVQRAAQFIQSIVDWFNQLSPAAQKVIAVIAVIVAAIGPVLTILGVLTSSIGSIVSFIGMLGPMVSGLGAAFTFLTGPVGLVIAAIAAAIAIGIALYKNWDTIKAKATEIAGNISATWNSIKARVTATVNGMKASVSAAFNAIKTKATTIFNAVKNAILKPIRTAVNTVRTLLNKIKGFFPVKVGKIMSGIKLPHFKISGSFSIKNKTVPHLSIDWYKTGGIFDSPSVIGVGEAGAEAVVPLDKFWRTLENMNGGDNITINVYGSDNMSVDDLAAAVERRLIQATNRRRLAYGGNR